MAFEAGGSPAFSAAATTPAATQGAASGTKSASAFHAPTSHSPSPDWDPSPELLAHVQKVWDGIKPNSKIYDILLGDIKLVRATKGRIVAHLELTDVHLNSKRILHGAVSATIMDWAGGMAIATTGVEKTGVSTDIHVNYVSTAREGDTLEIDAWVTRAGKTLGFTVIEIRKATADGTKGPPVATGTHTKYLNCGKPAAETETKADAAKESEKLPDAA